MLTEDYKVRLEAFEGPLDLLLFLIRKNEVDVHDIPVALIAGQYIAFLGQIDRVDIDVAGEFLVMAASLTEIKSRMVAFQQAPTPEGEEGPAKAVEDPRAELVRQLLAYKAYRDAAGALEGRLAEWQSRYPSSSVLPNDKDPLVAGLKAALKAREAELELEDLELVDLTEAFRKVMETVNFDRLGDHKVTYDDTPLEVHAADIVGALRGKRAEGAGDVEFAEIFRGKSRPQMVGLFLALLVLVRDRRVNVRQDRVDGSILLTVGEDGVEGFAAGTGSGSGAGSEDSAGGA